MFLFFFSCNCKFCEFSYQTFVAINHRKFNYLCFIEMIVKLDRCFPIWVEIVFNSLCVPFQILEPILINFIHIAFWIT